MAFRNLGRNRKRTGLALASLAIAQFFVLSTDGFMVGYGDALRDVMTGPMLGHVQVHEPEFREKRAMDLVIPNAAEKIAELRAEPAVKAVFPRTFAPSLAAKTEAGFTAVVVGLDTEAERVTGGFLDPGKVKAASGELNWTLETAGPSVAPHPAVIGTVLARRQGVKIGDELALMGQRADGSIAADLVKVVGTFASDAQIITESGIVLELAVAQDIFGLDDSVHELTLRGERASEAEQLAAKLEAMPSMQDLEVLPWQEGAPELLQMLGMMDYSTLIILAFIFLAAAAGIANTMVMSAFERTRETGVLLALGATPGRIIAVFVVETILLGTIGLSLGTLLGAAFNAYLHVDGFNMGALSGGEASLDELSYQGVSLNVRIFPRTRPVVLLQSSIAMGVTCFLAVLWPVRFITRMLPTEAMRK